MFTWGVALRNVPFTGGDDELEMMCPVRFMVAFSAIIMVAGTRRRKTSAAKSWTWPELDFIKPPERHLLFMG